MNQDYLGQTWRFGLPMDSLKQQGHALELKSVVEVARQPVRVPGVLHVSCSGSHSTAF